MLLAVIILGSYFRTESAASCYLRCERRGDITSIACNKRFVEVRHALSTLYGYECYLLCPSSYIKTERPCACSSLKGRCSPLWVYMCVYIRGYVCVSIPRSSFCKSIPVKSCVRTTIAARSVCECSCLCAPRLFF